MDPKIAYILNSSLNVKINKWKIFMDRKIQCLHILKLKEYTLVYVNSGFS